MSAAQNRNTEIPVVADQTPESSEMPTVVPVTVAQYSAMVDRGDFACESGQIELINGRIVRMNPQGPGHAHPIDRLSEWSFDQTQKRFVLRFEKPLNIPRCNSVPEPDIAWVTRKSYDTAHPVPDDVHLLIEMSVSSGRYDAGEKCDLYATAMIPEYWQIDQPRRELRRHREPDAGRYRSIETFSVDKIVSPLCLPSAKLVFTDLFSND